MVENKRQSLNEEQQKAPVHERLYNFAKQKQKSRQNSKNSHNDPNFELKNADVSSVDR